MFDKDRLELLIQYALLRAGEEDDFGNRNLGPIHIIKYVYLADLYYAEKHGDTFTHIEWQFYNFGPWSNNVYSCIDSSLTKIMASKATLESIYRDEDCVRWSRQDHTQLTRISRDIPAVITVKLSRDIHKYTNDTKALLDFVYKTKPMLEAAPHSLLQFTKNSMRGSEEEPLPTRVATLSKRKRKDFQHKLATLKAQNQQRQPRSKLVSPVAMPRTDEVYEHGIKWLESLSGNQNSVEHEMVVEFSDSAWNSDVRKNYDISR